MTTCNSFAAAPGRIGTGTIPRILIALMVITLLCVASLAQGAQWQNLKEPKISAKKHQRMLVVQAKGDPNLIGGKAFGLLFQLYYSMPETPKGATPGAPRARWPEALDTPKSDWLGLYALPVPEGITELPPYEAPTGLKASLSTWEYGEVAEILHIGPYNREEPTMQRLKEFVSAQGNVIVGGHEEEYILGPGMNGKGDPEKYVTILRYRVKKAERDK